MTKLQVKDSIHNFVWWTGIVAKVIMFQVAVALMVLGICYLANFRLQLVPLVQTISPVAEGK